MLLVSRKCVYRKFSIHSDHHLSFFSRYSEPRHLWLSLELCFIVLYLHTLTSLNLIQFTCLQLLDKLLKDLPLLTNSTAVPWNTMSPSVPAVLRYRDAISLDSSAGETGCLAALQTLHPDWGQVTALRVSGERKKLVNEELVYISSVTSESALWEWEGKKYVCRYTCSVYFSEEKNKAVCCV